MSWGRCFKGANIGRIFLAVTWQGVVEALPFGSVWGHKNLPGFENLVGYRAKSNQLMLHLRNLICLPIITLWLGCSKSDNVTGGHPMPWLYGITDAQKQLHRDFKAIINDTGAFGKLDSFLVDTIYCYIGPSDSCREIAIDFFNIGFVINRGDLFVLKEGRIRIIDIPFSGGNFHDIGLYQGSPEDFKYIEFGIMKDGEMKNCCSYSSLVRLDVTSKEIEFTYPLTSFSNYLIRLKGID